MKRLVNNNFKYIIGKYIMPIIGAIFNILTCLIFFKKTYFFFFHFNSYSVFKDLLKEIKSKNGIDLNNWRGHKICLWHDKKMISIHSHNGDCVISYFYLSDWDKNLNHQIYYLLN